MKFTAKENILLLDALALLSPESSMTTLRSWLKEGRVHVDGLPQKLAKMAIQKGQVISVSGRQRFAPGNLPILYDDRHLVVIDKPEGLLSVAAAFEKAETAHALLKARYSKVYPVHRLDQETSGVMLFALSEKARDLLKEAFSKHTIERVYSAIVEGEVYPKKGSWTSYQFEDNNYYVHNTQNPELGKFALTHYEVKASSKRYSFLELRLETGRKNQIRAHCEMVGHPIAGDKKYGAQTEPIKRVCLHARSLVFHHPITGKKMEFSSPLPPSFDKIVKSLRH